MGLAKLKTKISIEDYLEGEKSSDIKHEYIYGEVFAMAGTSDRHNRIALNFFLHIDEHLSDSDCEIFVESVKLKADARTFYYPDVMVACDESPESRYYRESPVLIIEVLSPTTERTDRNEKLTVYKNIPSLLEYVLVRQERMHIEIHLRQDDDSWLTYFYDETDGGEQIHFQSVDLTMTLEDIYRRVRFDN